MSFKAGDIVERQFDGQRGTVVDHGGVLVVKLDRGKVEAFEPANPKLWTLTPGRPALARAQVASIQYEAIKRLRRLRGEYAVKDWDSLTDRERIAFANDTPKDPEQRRVFSAIAEALQERKEGK